MSSSKTETAIEERPMSSNPLDAIPGEIPIRCALWTPDITRPSPGGDSRRSGGGQESELENERSGA